MQEDNECTLCMGEGTLRDNITEKEYRCPRCLGTGRNILKEIINRIIPLKKRNNKEETNDRHRSLLD